MRRKPYDYRAFFVAFAILSQFLLPLSSRAQGAANSIKGIVHDAKSEPLTGVSVVLRNTKSNFTIGGKTDSAGIFSFSQVPPGGPYTFSFSMVGYEAQTLAGYNLKDGASISLDVEMKTTAGTLDQVVVVGYGTQKRTSVTGAISSIKSDVMTQAPAVSIEQSMQGRLSGVQVRQSSGQPGAGISIQIRGAASIAGGNEPLYVIDGLPIFNSDVRLANGLNGINPNDIESIEVLKDAAAASIYGSRAANGVVLVTTKKGKSGSTKVTFDSYIGIQSLRKKLPLMNAEEFKSYVTNYLTNSTNIPPATQTKYLNELATVGGGVNTDWQDQLYRKALNQSYNLGISGGTEKNQYFVSGNYNKQEGIAKGSNFERFAVRINLNTKLSDWLTVVTRSTASRSEQNGFVATDGSNSTGGGANGVGSVLLAAPTVPVYNADGSFSKVSPYSFSGPATENPAAFLGVLNKNRSYYYQGGFDIIANPIKGLSNTARLGFNYSNSHVDTYFPSTMTVLPRQSASLLESKQTGYLLEDFLTYTFSVKKLRIETVAGFSAQQNNFNSILLAGTGFPSDQLSDNAIQAATSVAIPVTSVTKTTIASYFARTQLDYQGKYLFSASYRRDGASVFSDLNKWANFSAFSAGWRVNEEEFLKNTDVSTLKLRASWGQTGNQAISPYQSLYLATVVNTAQGSGNGVGVGLVPNLPNRNLTWETTTQTNIGVDFGYKRERYRLSIDYYIKDTKDLLATIQLPQSSGFSTISGNVGQVQNKGIEITLGSNIINKKDIGLNLDVNFSKNVNVVKATNKNRDIISDLLNAGNNGFTIVRVGQPLFSFYTPHYLGTDANKYPSYHDLNNDGLINALDNQVAGTALPKFFYGVNLDLRYKNFTLMTNWTGVSGAKINNLVAYNLTQSYIDQNKLNTIYNYVAVPSNRFVVRESDQYIEDASFFRMKNIRLNYKIPLKEKARISNILFYISGQNLVTFTKYTGYDPEVNTFSGTNARQGIDYLAYPTAKTVTIGVSATF